VFRVTGIRTRVVVAILVLAMLSVFCNIGVFAADLGQEKIIYTVANAHLDTQWNWDVRRTINEYLPKTFSNNFTLFEKYPDYEFNFEGAFRYALIKEYYPEAYERLRDYVIEGRWNVAGSSWDAGDVNIPSPEAIMRNILLGNKFFEREFGKTSVDIFLPDCFGFGYALPSIAVHMGLKGFSTQKLTWGSAYGIPFDIGRWYGVDGSYVIAALNPGSYTTTYQSSLSAPGSSWVNRVNQNGAYGLFVAYSYHGTGDTGGSPADGSARIVQQDIDKGVDPTTGVRVISASTDELFRDITAEQAGKLPYFDNELVMTTHAVGGYTSRAISKRWNRHNELLADATERASVIADWIGGAPYPKEQLDTAWKRFVWHQFHDDLPGTSLPSAYEISWNDYIISLNQFAEELTNGVGAIARVMNTLAEGIPVVVYNPVSKARKDVVEAEIDFGMEAPAAVRVFDPDGIEVPSQMLSIDGHTARIAFIAEMPSVGYKVYDVVPSETGCTIDTGLRVTGTTLENDYLKVTINQLGDISSIYDKLNDKELLAAPARLELFNDNSTTWPSWEILYSDLSSPREYVGGPAEITIVEQGPVRVAIQVTRKAAGSTFTQTIRLSASEDDRRVDVDNNVDWQSKATLLKAAFPLNVSNPKATYDLGLGVIQRGNNTSQLYEVPAQQWADITDTSGDYGVSIINDCKYGWDKPNNNTLRLTLIHTPRGSYGSNKQDVQDLGENRFLYSIYGHAGDWVEGETVKQGEKVNQPLRAFQTAKHDGDLGKALSFLAIDNPHITVKALKQAEDSDEIIVRVQETSGRSYSGVTLSMGNGIASAREVNGFEDHLGDALVEDGKLIFDIGRFEPKTFAITLDTAPIELVAPASRFIDLPYNKDVISFDSNRRDGAMDSRGITIPAEILPSIITSKGIDFRMGPKEDGQYNAVASNGQTITIPEGYRHVYLLATSIAGDLTATFLVNDTPVSVGIQDYREYVGGWDHVGNGTFRGIKRDPVAWNASHLHTPTGNSAYDYVYLFRYRIDLPEGQNTITLPEDENVLVFAMTASNNDNDDTAVAGELYDEKEPAKTYKLTVKNGTGSGSYPAGFEVGISANVPVGYRFKEWIGPVEDPKALNTTIRMTAGDMEVEAVLVELGTNLALNKPTSASGYVNNNERPALGVDGNRNTKWCSTNSGNKWLRVDLGSVQTINAWQVRHAGDGGENTGWNTRDFRLQISNDGVTWTDVDSVKDNMANITVGRIEPVKARYVRLYITDPEYVPWTGAARIYEFEIYGPQIQEIGLDVADAVLERNQVFEPVFSKALLVTGETVDLDLEDAIIEYYSSDTNVVSVEDNLLIAKNVGTAEVYARITYNGRTVETNRVSVAVSVSCGSIERLVTGYIDTGELTGPLVPQLKNSLKQAGHFVEMGFYKQAVHHMKNFVKHLNNPPMGSLISDSAKEVLNFDAEALIELFKGRITE